MKSLLHSLLIVITALCLASSALAANNKVADPTQLGPFKIGHTTMVLTDTTRNRNGSTPVSGPAEGRPLFVHIWYPLKGNCPSCLPTQYSVNNPIYDGTHTGYPLIFVPLFKPSLNGALEAGPISDGNFPLLIYSHGSTGSAGGGELSGLRETLASHGYIVAAVEHTGNNTIRSIGNLITPPVPSPSMGVGVDRMVRRSQDVRFVISQLLNPIVDPQFSSHIDANSIGLFGFSLGGGTTILTVAGLQSVSPPLLPDLRIKAAIPMDGTDFVGFSASDYSNVQIPLMLYQDGDGDNDYVFPQLVNSDLKYLVDLAAAQHRPSALPSHCSDLRQILLALEATPGQPAIVANALFNTYDAADGVSNIYIYYEYCDASLFKDISDATLTSILLDPVEVAKMKPLMPLRTQATLADFSRLSKWYVVSFFNKTLKQQDGYDQYLSNSKQNQKLNPIVEFSKNCRVDLGNPMDLQVGDKISFRPVGINYKITFSRGNAMLDKGMNPPLQIDDGAADVSLPFTFSMPKVGPFNHIKVYTNGAIAVDNFDVNNILEPHGFDYSADSPWMMRGELLLSGIPIIAPLLTDLNSSESGGVYIKTEAHRVIVTWDAVPIFTAANGGETSTMQVVINDDSTIDMIYGKMTTTGPDYGPPFFNVSTLIGMVGIATGKSDVTELNSDRVKFTSITHPVVQPGAFEMFYVAPPAVPCNN